MTAAPYRRALAALAALAGSLAAFGGSPYAAAHAVLDVERLAVAVANEEDHVTALELAAWIHDRRPGLRILDLRDAAAFDTYHVPRAERIPIESIATTVFPPTDTLVVVSGGGAHAAQAWVLFRALGYRQVYFLRDGLNEWIDDVMNPTIPANAPADAMARFQEAAVLSRYFGGVPRVVDSRSDSGTAPKAPPDRPRAGVADGNAAAAIVRRRGC